MKAGRELDALVAEKVFGCKVVRYNLEMTSVGCECPDNRHGEGISSDDLRRYSTDRAAAFEVVEAMRADWFSFKVWQPSKEPYNPGDPPLEHAVVSFVCGAGPCPRHNTDFDSHHGAYEVEGGTLPEAVCNAALVALKTLPAPERFGKGGGD